MAARRVEPDRLHRVCFAQVHNVRLALQRDHTPQVTWLHDTLLPLRSLLAMKAFCKGAAWLHDVDSSEVPALCHRKLGRMGCTERSNMVRKPGALRWPAGGRPLARTSRSAPPWTCAGSPPPGTQKNTCKFSLGAAAAHGAESHASTRQRCKQDRCQACRGHCQSQGCRTLRPVPKPLRLCGGTDVHLAGAEVPKRRQAVLEHPRYQVAGGGPGAAHARIPARAPRCLCHPPRWRRPVEVSASPST